MIEAVVSNPFYWIGVFVSFVTAIIIGFLIYVLWKEYGPRFHCRRPGAINVWSTFRSDIRGSEGQRIKGGEDMRIVRLIGCSWRLRWFFGLVTFAEDDGK